MSHVADVVLLTFLDDGGMKEVQDWFETNGWPRLVRISYRAGGDKAMQHDIWAAAINYFDIEGLAAAVRAAHWEWPESVQLLVKDENEECFTLRAGVAPHSPGLGSKTGGPDEHG